MRPGGRPAEANGAGEPANYSASIKVGELPVNVSLAAYYNVETPKGGAKWQARFQVQLLFPR